jgi:hypothetical protein
LGRLRLLIGRGDRDRVGFDGLVAIGTGEFVVHPLVGTLLVEDVVAVGNNLDFLARLEGVDADGAVLVLHEQTAQSLLGLSLLTHSLADRLLS